ncbi:hypothetical protein QF028_004958 [Neobacillus sp. B4I6]|uniref:aspartyl-phosphate phosphatase Spo0E family protein n=1 Tax=Neobacillus sp. B4I6 TaxID=3373925 RepID=UPI003D255C3B
MVRNLSEVLHVQIEQKRKEMILLGNQYSLTSPKVIQVSQQLDDLLNKLYYLQNHKYYINDIMLSIH